MLCGWSYDGDAINKLLKCLSIIYIMTFEHSVDEKISKKAFSSIISKFDEDDIEITDHALFRLNERQRKIYREDVLKRILLDEEPVEICKQINNNLAIIYFYKENRKIKIVIRISSNKIYIVTFYILNREQDKKVGK